MGRRECISEGKARGQCERMSGASAVPGSCSSSFSFGGNRGGGDNGGGVGVRVRLADEPGRATERPPVVLNRRRRDDVIDAGGGYEQRLMMTQASHRLGFDRRLSQGGG